MKKLQYYILKIQNSCEIQCAVWKWTNQLRLIAGNKVQKTEYSKKKSSVEYLDSNVIPLQNFFYELKTNILK